MLSPFGSAGGVFGENSEVVAQEGPALVGESGSQQTIILIFLDRMGAYESAETLVFEGRVADCEPSE